MTVNEAFAMAGQVYVMGVAIALGIAAMIKFICVVIDRSEQKTAVKAQASGKEGGAV